MHSAVAENLAGNHSNSKVFLKGERMIFTQYLKVLPLLMHVPFFALSMAAKFKFMQCVMRSPLDHAATFRGS